MTGRRGIQIWVPIAPRADFAQTRAWVQELSKTIGAVVPELVSWQWQRRERGGLARLDYTQNAVNKTLVAPYSPRPAPARRSRRRSPGTSSTIRRCARTRFTIRTVLDRLAERGDLFRPVLQSGQVLPQLRAE